MDASVAAVLLEFKCIFPQQRTAQKAFYSRKNISALLPTGFDQNFAKRCGGWGTRTCLMLPLARMGSLKLWLPGSTGGNDSDWSTVNVKDTGSSNHLPILASPQRFLWALYNMDMGVNPTYIANVQSDMPS